MSAVVQVEGVERLAERFDSFIVDQYGVLHDGNAPYPGAVDALVRLRQAGKDVLLLSNSGRRSAPNEERLVKLGFEPGSWSHFLSSGEIAWRRLEEQTLSLPGGKRLRCLLIARGGDRSAVEGLPLDLVEGGDEAEIVLVSGSDGDVHDIDYYRHLLRPAAEAGVACLCSNPDKVMLTKGGLRFGAGHIAEAYAEMGGTVTWVGKPYPEIYEVAKGILGRPPAGRTICIGDSIEHDIAGGSGAGLPTALVTTGIFEGTSPEQRDDLFLRHGARPDYLLDSFAW